MESECSETDQPGGVEELESDERLGVAFGGAHHVGHGGGVVEGEGLEEEDGGDAEEHGVDESRPRCDERQVVVLGSEHDVERPGDDDVDEEDGEERDEAEPEQRVRFGDVRRSRLGVVGHDETFSDEEVGEHGKAEQQHVADAGDQRGPSWRDLWDRRIVRA